MQHWKKIVCAAILGLAFTGCVRNTARQTGIEVSEKAQAEIIEAKVVALHDDALTVQPGTISRKSENGFKPEGEEITLNLKQAKLTEAGQEASFKQLQPGDLLRVAYRTKEISDIEILPEHRHPQGGSAGGLSSVSGTSASTLDSNCTIRSDEFISQGDDENALRIQDASVTLEESTVSKTGGSSSSLEDGTLHGLNAALLVCDKAKASIASCLVESSAPEGSGVSVCGKDTSAQIRDTQITTADDHSPGIQAAGGASLKAQDLTVRTTGSYSAAIRTNRGGETDVEEGTYKTSGLNAPVIYAAAKVQAANASLEAEHSEGVVVEGPGSAELENCTLSGAMSERGSSAEENRHTVMLYQSGSDEGKRAPASFTMKGGRLIGETGDLFYVTNTRAKMVLSGVRLKKEAADGLFLRVSGNTARQGWGKAGANGAQLECELDQQAAEGDIEVDAISSLQLTLKNKSQLSGAIRLVDNAKHARTDEAHISVIVGEGCIWKLTGDCTLTSLENYGTIDFNGHTITLENGTVLA